MNKKATKAVAVPTAGARTMHESISVRPIDNGYIISRSTDGPKGYKCSETYSATKPKIELPKVKK